MQIIYEPVYSALTHHCITPDFNYRVLSRSAYLDCHCQERLLNSQNHLNMVPSETQLFNEYHRVLVIGQTRLFEHY